MNCDVRVAVHVVGILNSLLSRIDFHGYHIIDGSQRKLRIHKQT